MKTKHFKIIALFFAVGLMAFSSCKKPDPDSQSAEDDARGSYIMADAFAVANNEAGDDGSGKAAYPEGMTVERDSGTHSVTITFENCNFRVDSIWSLHNIVHHRDLHNQLVLN